MFVRLLTPSPSPVRRPLFAVPCRLMLENCSILSSVVVDNLSLSSSLGSSGVEFRTHFIELRNLVLDLVNLFFVGDSVCLALNMFDIFSKSGLC